MAEKLEVLFKNMLKDKGIEQAVTVSVFYEGQLLGQLTDDQSPLLDILIEEPEKLELKPRQGADAGRE